MLGSGLEEGARVLARAWRITWVAAVTVALAGAVRAVVLPALGTRIPWVTFYPAVMLAALGGGFVSGTLATGLSCAAVAWFWNPMAPGPFLTGPADWLGLAVFAINGLLISAVAESTRRARGSERARRRQVEDREARLRSYFDSPMIGIAVTSPEKGWLEVNGAAERMLGYGMAELRGKTWAELTFPDDVEADVAEFDRIVSGESSGYTMDKRYVRKDGSTLWASMSVSCVRDADGRIEYFVALLTDITERKEAEASLQRSEATFRALADHAPVGIFQTGRDGLNTYVNGAAEKIIGLSREAIRGEGWSGAIHRDDRERVFREWRAAVDAGETFRSEYRFVHPDGGVVLVRGFGSAIRGALGAIDGYIGVIIDITDARALRDQLAISARLAALGTLVAGVTHEMNNPLAVALSSLSFAESEARALHARLRNGKALDEANGGRSLGDVVDALVDAQDGAKRAATIVKSMADFSRPETGGERISVQSAIEQAVRWLPSDVARHVDVQVEMNGPGNVIASENQLAAIVVSLVTNSAAAIPAGRKGTVIVRAGLGSAGRVRIEVEDDGIGMEPAVLQRMFDPFFSTRQPGKGVGMGLPVAHAIVQALGGTIGATSSVGVGTTFRIELPVAT